MGAVIVLGDKLQQQNFQLGVALQGLGGEPFFEGTHEAFGNAIRLRTVARNQDMNELRIAHQAAKSISRKMRAAIRNEKLQCRRQQHFQRGHYEFRRHFRSRHK